MPSLSVSSTCMASPILDSTLSSSFSMRSRMPDTLSRSRFCPMISCTSAGFSTCARAHSNLMTLLLPGECTLSCFCLLSRLASEAVESPRDLQIVLNDMQHMCEEVTASGWPAKTVPSHASIDT